MQQCVVEAWPGNSTPTIRGHKDNDEKLDRVLKSLESRCTYYVPSLNVCFGPKAMRQHALAVLNERRRQIHAGHDYDTVGIVINT